MKRASSNSPPRFEWIAQGKPRNLKYLKTFLAHVRVLDIHPKPGEKSPIHSHPNHVVYSLNGETLRFTLADGKTNTATIKAGQAVWRTAETHTVENVGKNEAHALDIELKK